jgi:hypothetical protein
MSGRGVLFAIGDDVLERLGNAANDAEALAIVNEVEERWENACELDKAWDAIHRALTDGRLSAQGTESAIVSVKTADRVEAIAHALRGWDRARFRAAYHRIDRNEYGELDEEDFTYSLAWFERLAPFYERAARSESAVLFSADL